MASNITISIKDFCDAMRRSFEKERDMLADRKELELQAKASGINVSAAKKWLKAEVFDDGAQNPKRVARLIEQTVDQVMYGESLGHDLGMFQNNEARPHVEVRNGSNQATKTPEATVKGEAAGTLPRIASPAVEISTQHPNPATSSPPETGGDAASSSLASSPTNSDDFDPVRDMPAHLRR